ncbi:MAG TPA: prolyl oligopeptidase family serine peptidase [Pyrinomonadaceae bacterium]|nr:prolyl oligopeptidase family serine peptidase [Pyrinomonadaceae bacterium]
MGSYLNRRALAALLCQLFVGFSSAFAQADEIAPGPDLVTQGIPKVPVSLARTAQHYTTNAYGLPVAGWEATKREIWIKDLKSDSTVVYRVAALNGATQPMLNIPTGVYDIYYQPQGKYLVYNQDTNGNEQFQMYLYNIETGKSTLLTDGKSRNTEPVWSNAGDRIILSTSPAGGKGVSLSAINPLDPQTNRVVAQSSGNYFKAFDWSPDDQQAVFIEYTSNTTSALWLVDVRTGEKTLLSPKEKTDEYYDSPQFAKDGRGVYVITDHECDFRRLAYVDLAAKTFRYLSGENADVEDFRIASDGKTLAFISNEEGISGLHLLDTKSSGEKSVPNLPSGIISDLYWHKNSQDLAFNFKSARTPTDVYSLNIGNGQLTQWTKGKTGDADITKIPEPEVVHWKSFDGRTISGFLFRPPAKWTGRRPVVIDIHGGPEEQYRPSFWGQDNYLLNELGVAKIYPNVRGSSGYGKTFLNLDNGLKREGAVKDLGALLDWIKTQPYLDAEHVMVTGASYGGYMSLSVAANYSDRITAAQSVVGPSNLVTFLENTEGWRRDVRRAEYGDERDPKMREFLGRIAPLNNAQSIKKPLFIVQGMNDPRVKTSEAEQMVSAVKKNGAPVWYLLAKDEGHDFANQKNIDFQFYATVLFIQDYLMK